MTTIAWNGKVLAADSNVTFTQPEERFKAYNGRYARYSATKIISGKTYLFNGEPVQALAVAGDVFALYLLDEMSKQLEGQSPEDLMFTDSFKVIAGYCQTSFIVLLLLEHNTVLVSFNKEGGDQSIQFQYYERATPLAFGSGVDQLIAASGICAVTSAIAGLDPTYLVRLASMKCACTGGTLTVWNGETIRTDLPMPSREEVRNAVLELDSKWRKQQPLLLAYNRN